MNRELRELLDTNNIKVKKITIKNNVKIINTPTGEKIVIKKRNRDLQDLFKYLDSRSFDYYPKIILKSKNYDIYEYINDADLSKEERALDIINLITRLHNKTTYYKDIDEDNYKEIYENIVKKTEYLQNYYNDYADIIEREEYMSPSQYLFIRNITKIFQALDFSRRNIDKWYDIINEKKRIRIVNIHNNLTLDHYRVDNKPYLISWNKSKKDLPIYDIINFYKKYYLELDFCELLRNYELSYPLLPEEKLLLFTIITIPSRIEFTSNEYKNCQIVKKFYDYLNTSEKFITDYLPQEKEPQ